MTKLQLYTFVTNLLDGNPMDTTLFDTFLDVAQSYWENQRPWVALRTESTGDSIGSNNTFTTEKSLPTNFRKWYTRFPVQLADSQGNIQVHLREVPIDQKLSNKGDVTKFYCDYITKKYYVCGAPGQTLSAYLYYIKRGTKISTSDSQEWELDVNDEFTKILAFTIAVYWKLGIDYDIINNSQADANSGVANAIYQSMVEWDGDLQRGMLSGQDYGSNYGWSGNANGGRIA